MFIYSLVFLSTDRDAQFNTRCDPARNSSCGATHTSALFWLSVCVVSLSVPLMFSVFLSEGGWRAGFGPEGGWQQERMHHWERSSWKGMNHCCNRNDAHNPFYFSNVTDSISDVLPERNRGFWNVGKSGACVLFDYFCIDELCSIKTSNVF